MSAKPIWLEYQPHALELNRPAGARGLDATRVDFPAAARMLYNEADNVIALENVGRAAPFLRRLADAGAELRRLEYAMLIDLPEGQTRLNFYHPLKPGNGVRVRLNDRGEFFLMQDSGAPLFSKDYTLRDVSRGKINSSRAVWQFHGYRHEH